MVQSTCSVNNQIDCLGLVEGMEYHADFMALFSNNAFDVDHSSIKKIEIETMLGDSVYLYLDVPRSSTIIERIRLECITIENPPVLNAIQKRFLEKSSILFIDVKVEVFEISELYDQIVHFINKILDKYFSEQSPNIVFCLPNSIEFALFQQRMQVEFEKLEYLLYNSEIPDLVSQVYAYIQDQTDINSS